jgi:S-methylmethionine-dependent homocysteine/selenocysteine methylase
MTTARPDLLARLAAGPVICAEGFLFELERRGYLAAGEFVPEVALDHPEALEALHRDYQRAGSDIVEAFTYNGHREKMRVIGKEDLLEPLNRAALQIAKKVAANRPGDLMAGNISNTNVWHPEDKATQAEVRSMFDEMVGWAVEEGAEMIIGETFYYAGEAFEALDAIKATGLPAVVTIAPMAENRMMDGIGIVETCKELEARGADVVGMNCFRGPATMLPWLKRSANPSPAMSRRCRSRTEPRSKNRRSSICPIGALAAARRRMAGPSQPRSIRSTAIGTRSAPLPKRLTRWASTISASAAARRRCSSARSPKRSAGPPRRAATRRRWPTTSCTALMRGSPTTSGRSATGHETCAGSRPSGSSA